MKTLLALITLLTSLSSFAAKDPNFCDGDDVCRKGRVLFLASGTYYARGYGRTCAEAKSDSDNQFVRNHGDMACGLYDGPYSPECYREADGTFVSWHRCNPDSGPMRGSRSGRCANVMGSLVCN